MAEFATIARPYAKALFDLAIEKNQIESWLGGLKELAWLVQQPKVGALINEPEASGIQKADELSRLLNDSEVMTNTEFRNFVYVVAEEKRYRFCLRFMLNIKVLLCRAIMQNKQLYIALLSLPAKAKKPKC